MTTEIGIKLNIKPQIHFDKEVTMNVNVDLTELVSMVEGHPWTAKRQIKTPSLGQRQRNSGYRRSDEKQERC